MGQKSQKHLAAPNINSLWTRNVKRPCVPSCAILGANEREPLTSPTPTFVWIEKVLESQVTAFPRRRGESDRFSQPQVYFLHFLLY